MLSTKLMVAASRVDDEVLVSEPIKGLGQWVEPILGGVRSKISSKAAVSSSSVDSGKRITPSRFDIFFATPRALCLRDLFGHEATVPLESSLIDQKLKAEAAVPSTKLDQKICLSEWENAFKASNLALSNPRTQALVFTGVPAKRRVPVHSIGVKAPTRLSQDPNSNGVNSYLNSATLRGRVFNSWYPGLR